MSYVIKLVGLESNKFYIWVMLTCVLRTDVKVADYKNFVFNDAKF
jgi:hypothetical protein